jgi:hypothetical protein
MDEKSLKLPALKGGAFDRALGPEHVEGLPGKVACFYIVPLNPVLKDGACGHVPVRTTLPLTREKIVQGREDEFTKLY